MLAEEALMLLMGMEALRRQHCRDHRHLGVELDAHQPRDHRLGDEFVAVDAAIDNEPGADDGGVAAGFRQQLRLQRDLEAAGDFEEVDAAPCMAELGNLGGEAVAAAIDDLLVPAGLDEGDALAAAFLCVDW